MHNSFKKFEKILLQKSLIFLLLFEIILKA